MTRPNTLNIPGTQPNLRNYTLPTKQLKIEAPVVSKVTFANVVKATFVDRVS